MAKQYIKTIDDIQKEVYRQSTRKRLMQGKNPETKSILQTDRFYQMYISPTFGKIKINKIKKGSIIELQHTLLKEYGFKPSSLYQRLTKALSPILREIELNYGHPTFRAEFVPVSQVKTTIYNHIETIQRIYNSIMKVEDDIFRATFILEFYGRRVGECKNLDLSQDVNYEKQSYTIRDVKNGEVEQTYYLPNELTALLPTIDKLEFKHNAYYKEWEKLKIESGINYSPHKMRAILATNLINNGMQIHDVKAVIGHVAFSGAFSHYATVDRLKASKTAYQMIQKILGDKT